MKLENDDGLFFEQKKYLSQFHIDRIDDQYVYKPMGSDGQSDNEQKNNIFHEVYFKYENKVIQKHERNF